MASSKTSLQRRCLSFVKSKLIIHCICAFYILFAQLACGQICETLPCTQSIAQYTVATYVPPDKSTAAHSVYSRSTTPTPSIQSTSKATFPSKDNTHHTAAGDTPSNTPDTRPSVTQAANNITTTALEQFSRTKPVNLSRSSANATSSTNCGPCSVAAEQVQVYYWPTASVKSDCPRAASAILPQDSQTYASNATTTLTASTGQITTDVIDGFT